MATRTELDTEIEIQHLKKLLNSAEKRLESTKKHKACQTSNSGHSMQQAHALLQNDNSEMSQNTEKLARLTLKSEEEVKEVCNSEDEHDLGCDQQISEEDWVKRDNNLRKLISEKGFVVENMKGDGACLFRAVADQVFEDQNKYIDVRSDCMDYISNNKKKFCDFITIEDMDEYIARKRNNFEQGNHVEIQALSDMYMRTIEVYSDSSDKSEPDILIISPRTDLKDNKPIRISYHRKNHYNSVRQLPISATSVPNNSLQIESPRETLAQALENARLVLSDGGSSRDCNELMTLIDILWRAGHKAQKKILDLESQNLKSSEEVLIAQTGVGQSGSQQRYTYLEDKMMIAYILNKGIENVDSNEFWKKMKVELRINRTWDSLKHRFKRIVAEDQKVYTITLQKPKPTT